VISGSGPLRHARVLLGFCWGRPVQSSGAALRGDRSTAVAFGRIRVALDIALAMALAVFVWQGVCRYLYGGAIEWDFFTYYGAASAAAHGKDPYDTAMVAHAIGKLNTYPFVYSPVALQAFAPLAHLPRADAMRVWTVIKVGSLVLLLGLWATHFVPRGARVWFVLLCAFGFRETITRDLLTGNVSLIEQVLLWSGFACFRRGKFLAFAALTVTASVFKLTLPWFLLLLLCPGLGSDRRRARTFAGATVALAAVTIATVWLWPDRCREFVRVLPRFAPGGPLFEAGADAPSICAWLSDCVRMLDPGMEPSRLLVWALYCVVSSIVLMTSWRALQRLALRAISQDGRRLWAILLLCFVFALVSPRFKDYSYILLLVPTFRVLLGQRRVDFPRALLLGAMLLPPGAALMPGLNGWVVIFWSYYCWLVAGAVWLLAIRGASRTFA
jgi:hypothetical protein